MTVEQLKDGYEYVYRRLFSYRSIWNRRPKELSAVIPYLIMSQLYKQSNWLWHFLIKHRLTHAVWRPLIELTRWRHLRFRRQLKKFGFAKTTGSVVISPGV